MSADESQAASVASFRVDGLALGEVSLSRAVPLESLMGLPVAQVREDRALGDDGGHAADVEHPIPYLGQHGC